MQLSLQELINLAIAFVVGGGASAVAARRAIKDVTVTGAETRVVELLREELERLSEELKQVRMENASMHAELLGLREQNSALHAELTELREELRGKP